MLFMRDWNGQTDQMVYKEINFVLRKYDFDESVFYI